jgi:hypothetical protein
MKESSDDIITKRIKEVLEQYEPDYSPQFWEKIRKQRPLPELRLITLLQKYKFWLSVLTIAGVLFIVYMATDLLPADKNSAVDPLSPESLNYSVSEKSKEITNSEKTSASGNSISYNSIDEEERNISSKVMPVRITDPLPAAYQDYIPAENAISEGPERIEKIPGLVLLEEIDFGNQYNSTQLIPVKYRPEEIQLLKDRASNNNNNKLIFHWPDFNSPVKKEGYDKFVGPNKLAFFYSPEIHFNGSFGTVGVSQGIGISLDGPIRSSVSISAGLSFQETNFHNKIIFSGKVPPHAVLQPPDTNRTFYYNDSTVFNSGSYKFLELPVSVTYKFIESPRSQIWLGAGISAIAFLRQNYTYEKVVEEISETSSISVKAWNNIHPLASLNFSLLYRYNLSSRFILHGTIQYKQHLVPLGYNSMKLNRLNFQVGIIYRFGRED